MTDTKQITFEGRTYEVPTWVKFVARDKPNYVYGFDSRPNISVKDGYFYSKSEFIRIFPASDNSWRDSLVEV